jgi:hypothetical protein
MNRELFRTIISEGWEYISEVEQIKRDVDFEQEGKYPYLYLLAELI